MKNSQLKIFFLVLLLAAAMPLFAQGVLPGGLQNTADAVLEAFTGNLVKVILIICLAGCGVAYGFNKDNDKMKKNIIAIAVATAIVIFATTIVDLVWEKGP